MIEQALGQDDINEVLSFSRGPLSENAAKDGRSATGDSQHDEPSVDLPLPLPQPVPPRHDRILQSHRDLLEEYRRAEKRLLLKSQIQQVFLEGELPATSRIERIMEYFDEHFGHGEDPILEVVAEDEILVEPKPATPEPEDIEMNETGDETDRTKLNNLVDKLTKVVHRLGSRTTG